MNLSGAAAKPLAGENDLAQNPFDLEAERGPSLFDARHRFVASATWEPRPAGQHAGRVAGPVRRLADERHRRRTTPARRSPSPTRPTCRCRPTARRSPGSRQAARTSSATRTAARGRSTQWLSRDAFQRLNIQTQAGQFGDAGRNIARGPGYTNVDVSLVRNFVLRGDVRLQFRAEAFNVANHANFGLPVADSTRRTSAASSPPARRA